MRGETSANSTAALRGITNVEMHFCLSIYPFVKGQNEITERQDRIVEQSYLHMLIYFDFDFLYQKNKPKDPRQTTESVP